VLQEEQFDALYAWAGSLSSTLVWSRVELFFLQHWAGSEPVGLFTVAVTLANLASQGPMLLTAGLLPYFAANFGKGATGEMKAAYAAATRVLAFIVLPVAFGMAGLLPTALPLIYGQAFAGAVPAATVLVLGAGISGTASVGTTLVMAMDRSDFIFISGSVSAILAIGAGLLVIPEFGLMGAVWSRAAIQLAAIAIGGGFMLWGLRIPLPIADLARLLAAAAVCGIAARGVLTMSHGPLALVPAIAAGAVSYAAAVRLFGALRPGDAERLRTLCGAFPARVRDAAERVIALLAPKMKAVGDAD
jgi:O-antigen/teichoic acid export membrane protein